MKILLILEQKQNRYLLLQLLQEVGYEVVSFSANDDLLELHNSFDLCILDSQALDKLSQWIKVMKEAEEPVLIPFLLITSRQDVKMVTRYLWKTIDELITTPIEKIELQVRIEALLYKRRLSLELKEKNDNLQEINELKSRFISVASHEFRNPLNVILAYTQILDAKGKKLSSEKKQDLFSRIKVSVNKMTDILNDVLILTKGEFSGQKCNVQLLDLQNFCHQLISEIKMGVANSHKINFTIQGELRAVYLDGNLLRHILTNLLTNAIKYSSPGSNIDFDLIAQNTEIIFKIKDRGIGIPVKDQPYLFESFHRASNVGNIPGTGLGLAIIKQSVDLHKGIISVDSEVGIGTTFTVSLPLVRYLQK
ncbi:MAG: ATP-binding protein [Cyanobacteria bacterium P01_A01_bin.84]